MAWLRRGVDEPVAPARPGAGDASPEAPAKVDHRAPGLRTALERLRRPGASILDLGPPLAQNVSFFNRLGARVRILDLEATLVEERLWVAPAKLDHWEARVPAVLDLDPEARFDLVLAWDLMNYLGRERWPTVAKELVARVAPGGMVHLLARTGKEMPDRPSHFRWIDSDQIREEPRATATRQAPRLSHGEIEKLNPGLAAAKSFLDKTGLQELLLERSEELNLPARAVAEPRQYRKPATYYPR